VITRQVADIMLFHMLCNGHVIVLVWCSDCEYNDDSSVDPVIASLALQLLSHYITLQTTKSWQTSPRRWCIQHASRSHTQ